MKHDAAIIGAGIAGLSLAHTLHRQGKRIVVLEKSAIAQGASVRNFGMVWPLGHPVGHVRTLAMRSREIWLEVAREAGFWANPRGSLTLAYEEVEEQVLHEFMDIAEHNPSVGRLISAEQAQKISPAVKSDGLKLALHSTQEVCVDPREAVHVLARHLAAKGIEIRFGTPVSSVGPGAVKLAGGGCVEAENVIVAAGPDLRDLLPSVGPQDGLRRCTLQMMRFAPKSRNWPTMGAHLCAGLTLGHYANFADCPSIGALRAFHQERWPLQVEHGIHVLVSQHADGSLTVGDSHDYGESASPYLSAKVESAILEALDQFLDWSEFSVAERWFGHYNTSPGRFYSWRQVDHGVWSLNLFGTGMTLSFGVAELVVSSLAQ
ncbi:MAG: TIGR03364 family FAD-dependent oxidoreductase [Armatimonadetes bacterium]|nr:TIGR03364 family FAD-dependent oxidoreductase [Armatimonadota bacterium]